MTRPHQKSETGPIAGRNRIVWLVTLLVGITPWLGSCVGPEPGLPPGTVLVLRGNAGRNLLAELATLRGTPIAVAAETALSRLGECRDLVARCPEEAECDLLANLRCDDRSEVVVAESVLGTADAFYARRFGRSSISIRANRDGAGWAATAEVREPSDAGLLSLLLPGSADPGPPELSPNETLLHLRVEPKGGLRLGRFVTPGGGADRLFNLRSDLFLGRVLDGAWELAVYVPEEGQIIPPTAVALDSSRIDDAERALAAFVEELRRRWPILTSPFPGDGENGACLSNLNVMPALAPCHVTTGSGLVLGWNAGSVRRALRRGESAGRDHGGRSFLHLDLDRFPLADERIRRATGSLTDLSPLRYPWQTLEVVGEEIARNRLRFEARLTSREQGP